LQFIHKDGDYGFHAIDGAIALDADISSDVNTSQVFHIGYHPANNAWWIQYKNQWLGYIDANYWSPVLTKGTGVRWYGEVGSNDSQFPCTQMGNGKRGTESGSAQMTNMFYEVFDSQGRSILAPAKARMVPYDHPPAGTSVWDGNPPPGTDGVSGFSYGGPGFCST
jgi:Neprosin